MADNVDPYLLFLAHKHPNYQKIILQIFPQLFQVSYRSIKSNIQNNSKYQERFKKTSQNPKLENDPYCQIMLKGIIEKADYESIRIKFNVDNLQQMYPFNQNNYFLMYACSRLADINHDSTQQKYQKIANILKLSQRQIQFTMQKYKQEAWMTCKKKFNFLKQKKQRIWHILSPFLHQMLSYIENGVTYAALQYQKLLNNLKPQLQNYSTSIWLKYLQIESGNQKLQEQDELIWANQLNKHGQSLLKKLDQIIRFPECSLNYTLYRKEDKFLRKIYYDRKALEVPKFYYSQKQWELNYLGKQIQKSVTSNANIHKVFPKAAIIQQKKKKQQQQDDVQQHEQVTNQKQQKKQQMQAQIQLKLSFQSKFNQEQEQNQSKNISQNIEQNIQKNKIQNKIKCQESEQESQKDIDDCLSVQNCEQKKDTDYIQLWIIFLMKKAKLFDKKICNKRFGLFRKQVKQIAYKKRKIKLFTKYFPMKLQKTLSKLNVHPSRDPDERKLLKIIAENEKNNNIIQKTDQRSQLNESELLGKKIVKKRKLKIEGKNNLSQNKNKQNQQLPLRDQFEKFKKKNLVQNKKYKSLQKYQNQQSQALLKNQFFQKKITQSVVLPQRPKSEQISSSYKATKQYQSNSNSNQIEGQNEKLQSQQKKIQQSSLDIAQKDLCVYLAIKLYTLQNPLTQILLKMSLVQIVQYYASRKNLIQKTGNQYIQLLKDNPSVWKSLQGVNLRQALTKKYMKQLEQQFEDPMKMPNQNYQLAEIESEELQAGQIKIQRKNH